MCVAMPALFTSTFEAAVDIPHRGEQRADRVFMRQVRRYRQRVAAQCLDAGGDLIQEFGAARNQDGPRPLPGKRFGNGAADPIACASDDHDLVLQLLAHCPVSAAMARRPGYRVARAILG
jgi:hypothetical protein